MEIMEDLSYALMGTFWERHLFDNSPVSLIIDLRKQSGGSGVGRDHRYSVLSAKGLSVHT